MRILPVVAAVTAAFLVVACSSPTPPKGVTVVNNFDAKRYLGTWYEIARFDHRFERGLDKVTATYSLRDDGGINVINKGYNPDREMWQKTDNTSLNSGIIFNFIRSGRIQSNEHRIWFTLIPYTP